MSPEAVPILFNLIITLISVWAVMIINAKFFRPTRLNKKQLTIYELRNRLYMLAAKGLIDSDSEEYETLLWLMNVSLQPKGNFRISWYVRRQAQIYTDDKLKDHLNNIFGKMKSDEMPHEYRDIAACFFSVAHTIYLSETRLLRLALMPAVRFFTILSQVIHLGKTVRKALLNMQDRINSTRSELKHNIDEFATA